ncbi:hypothetical protein G9409_09805 [Chlorobium sp. BLA1]|uniref:COG2958 family protein n=1 Tax=Candidatus Chlorobium masyuteum TaxID=2716876 RepID=UPI001421BE57|nr:HTH domain-containing protein [Candidatus Chlorobium masyuteum]NHQ60867.1 hypothetical protein [Candidatus Chlorobium masyuteum]
MAGYSFLDLAYEVLLQSPAPLTYQEIWNKGKESGLTEKIRTSGKTPWQSLGAQLYIEVRDNDQSRFIKAGERPARFFLASREKELPSDIISVIEKAEAKTKDNTVKYQERDLHPLLAYFAYANLSFNRGRPILTKTIFHEKSQKAGYNEWVHPDMVGFYLPIKDWKSEVIELNRLSDNNSLRLFSFELKKQLNRANYREAFFQAVSNSSWAHEGYLVAPNILQNDDFLSELERLASSFGIGIIHLDLADIDASTILYPAHRKEALDWETINKLCLQNKDFEKFLQDVKIDFESKRLHRSEYDEVHKEIKEYIRSKLHIDVLE